jgi:hypothetical protein
VGANEECAGYFKFGEGTSGFIKTRSHVTVAFLKQLFCSNLVELR